MPAAVSPTHGRCSPAQDAAQKRQPLSLGTLAEKLDSVEDALEAFVDEECDVRARPRARLAVPGPPQAASCEGADAPRRARACIGGRLQALGAQAVLAKKELRRSQQNKKALEEYNAILQQKYTEVKERHAPPARAQSGVDPALLAEVETLREELSAARADKERLAKQCRKLQERELEQRGAGSSPTMSGQAGPAAGARSSATRLGLSPSTGLLESTSRLSISSYVSVGSSPSQRHVPDFMKPGFKPKPRIPDDWMGAQSKAHMQHNTSPRARSEVSGSEYSSHVAWAPAPSGTAKGPAAGSSFASTTARFKVPAPGARPLHCLPPRARPPARCTA